jgi:LDH2 family malate/lactate/ureidoglycolate dehydrogenase
MSTMISEVYDVLKEAGASEEKARKAAEAIAAYDTCPN